LLKDTFMGGFYHNPIYIYIYIVFNIQFHFTINKRLDEYLENNYILHSMKELMDNHINIVSTFTCVCVHTHLDLHCECSNMPNSTTKENCHPFKNCSFP